MSYVIFFWAIFAMLLHLSVRELNNYLLDFFHLLMVEYNAYKIPSILFHKREGA